MLTILSGDYKINHFAIRGFSLATNLKYTKHHEDNEWGSKYSEVLNYPNLGNILICHVNVSDLDKISDELSKMVMDHSWIMKLDPVAKDSYESAVKETSLVLQKTFKDKLTKDNKIATEFGELMVSMGASRALSKLFDHISIPIAELWKPKKKQNEGFDFHTVCLEKFINFGEAKYSGSSNPYGGKSGTSSGAGGQADGFISASKHKRDRVHLDHLAGKDASDNLGKDNYGVILAFSLNSEAPFSIFEKAIETANEYFHLKQAKKIYLVGVSHAFKD